MLAVVEHALRPVLIVADSGAIGKPALHHPHRDRSTQRPEPSSDDQPHQKCEVPFSHSAAWLPVLDHRDRRGDAVGGGHVNQKPAVGRDVVLLPGTGDAPASQGDPRPEERRRQARPERRTCDSYFFSGVMNVSLKPSGSLREKARMPHPSLGS